MVLRYERFLNRTTTEIQALFNTNLDTNIGIANVLVKSTSRSQSDLLVKSITISNKVISIEISPQFPLVSYYVEFVSTPSQKFQDATGNYELLQDGNSNRIYFLGLEDDNIIRESLIAATPPVYDVENNTLVRKHISNISEKIFDTLVSIRETANANYLSETVVDEIHKRGNGPRDRLANESVYVVDRVALTPSSNPTDTKTIEFLSSNTQDLLGNDSGEANQIVNSFPTDPVSLQMVSTTEEVSNAEQLFNKFEGMLLTLSNSNIVRVNSVVLTRGNTSYIYNIPKYKYGLSDNRYDTASANKLLYLDSNQIKLSDASVLNAEFVEPTGTDIVSVAYDYLDKGISPDASTLQVYNLKRVVRETVPPLMNVFSLGHFPIVSSTNAEITVGGVSFLDPSPPSGAPYSTTHRAFKREVPYSQTSLPNRPGEYSVNYSTGQVFCYGIDNNGNGTDVTPPVATYYYRNIFESGIDYVYNDSLKEVVATAARDLAGQEAIIEFDFDSVLVDGVDYISEVHNEVINEYVENRFEGNNVIFPSKVPLTDVFRVYNETTGEQYRVVRFDDDRIRIAATGALPRIQEIVNEPSSFKHVDSEELYVSEEISTTLTQKLVKVNLAYSLVAAGSGPFVGDNLNSSIYFSNSALFANEFYYDNILLDLSGNLAKLSIVGDYLVDYQAGVIYVILDINQDSYLGSITYDYCHIQTVEDNILGVNGLEYKLTSNSSPVLTTNYSSFSVDHIIPGNMPNSIERFLLGDTDKPILLGAIDYGILGQWTQGSTTFVALDASFTSDHADGYHVLRIVGDSDRLILSVIDKQTVTVDFPFTSRETEVSWCLLDTAPQIPSIDEDGYKTITSYDIKNIRGVYLVNDLQTLDSSSITNYWDPSVDTFENNIITFRNTSIQSIPVGTALAIDYGFGSLFASYTAVTDNVLISYEWGDNSLNFGISDRLAAEDEYYVSYKYGALREDLINNFSSLVQIPQVSALDLDFNRELMRSYLAGSLQSFVRGPTVESFENLVSSVTYINPEINELTFNEWTLGRDNLFLENGQYSGTPSYDTVNYASGLVFGEGNYLKFPSEAYISHKDGTFEAWIKPYWDGIDNDAKLTFSISSDGYSAKDAAGLLYDGYLSLNDIYIGNRGWHPETIPFEISRFDAAPNDTLGRPNQYGTVPGTFIWFDDDQNRWTISNVSDPVASTIFTGSIESTGDIYNIVDGYNTVISNSYLELSDSTTTMISKLDFLTRIDGYEYADGYDGYLTYQYSDKDGYTVDGYFFEDIFYFSSDNHHYIFDTGPSQYNNRISLFKDGSGYLNLRVYDNSGQLKRGAARSYNLSSDISSWRNNEVHCVGAAWRFNTAEGADEMHLFVDGFEQSNIFKYGGKPETSPTSIFRTRADEYIELGATLPIFGGSDGITIAGSNVFESPSATFVTNGVLPGATFYILDSTVDGLASPYTVATIISETQLTLTSVLTLGLTDVKYSVNTQTYTLDTNVSVEKIAVYTEDGYGTRTELAGIDATIPDYSIFRVGGENQIRIENGVDIGDAIVVNTLGLTRGRCRGVVFKYTDDQFLNTKFSPPASLDNFDLYKIPFVRTAIIDTGTSYSADGYFSLAGLTMSGTFTGLCQPSNSVAGKKYKLTLHGTSNIDFTGTNQATLNGTTFEGPTSEVVTFTAYGYMLTTNHWLTVTSIDFSFDGLDSSQPFGAIEMIEAYSMTESENSGDYAQLYDYDNGQFEFLIYGSGGVPFVLESCYYLVDYPTPLNIPMSMKGPLYIGSDVTGNRSFNGAIEQVVFLNEMLSDVRTGEDKRLVRSITKDFNSPTKLSATAQTMMLLDLDNKISNRAEYYRIYDEKFITSSNSVNDSFGDALVLSSRDPFIIDNGKAIMNSDSGSIELWISPLLDIYHDMDATRFFVDITSNTIDVATTIGLNTVKLTRRARRINKVTLTTDIYAENDLFANGTLLPDGVTIVLGKPLPSPNLPVNVDFVPIDFQGDRFSIYKDGYNSLNFSIVADDTAYIISHPISWKRGTWHRILATWDVSNRDNQDRMRLMVDGVEGGTVLWGTAGLLYGSGVVYGSAIVGTPSADFLTTDINVRDTFGEIVIGNSYDGIYPGFIKIDNLRFSMQPRSPTVVGGINYDLNYNSNLEAVSPVVQDALTTGLFDFDKSEESTEFLSNLLGETTPLFTVDINVDDGFRRIIDNDRAKDLLKIIIERLKPAHTNILTKFVQDQ